MGGEGPKRKSKTEANRGRASDNTQGEESAHHKKKTRPGSQRKNQQIRKKSSVSTRKGSNQPPSSVEGRDKEKKLSSNKGLKKRKGSLEARQKKSAAASTSTTTQQSPASASTSTPSVEHHAASSPFVPSSLSSTASSQSTSSTLSTSSTISTSTTTSTSTTATNPVIVEAPEQPKLYNLRDIPSEKDTEVDVSSNSGSSLGPPPAHLRPPSVNDHYFRRVVFVCVGEADANGLTRNGEEMATRVAAVLRPVQLYYSAVMVAPTVPCLRMARLIANALPPESVNRNHFFAEPGLLDVYDRNQSIVDDERPFLPSEDPLTGPMHPNHLKTPSGTPPTKNRATVQPLPPDNSRLAYLPFTTRAQVRAEKTYEQFESRVVSTIQHVVIAQHGCLLLVLDAGPFDAAFRALIGLPPRTVRDYTTIVNGTQGRPPSIPAGCVAIIEQCRLGGHWEVRHKFDALTTPSGRAIEIDMTHLKRTV